MQREKAIEIVGYQRMKAKSIGNIIWIILIILAIAIGFIYGWIFIIIPIILGFAFGSVYSVFKTKQIERLTGLNIHEQEIAYSESMVAKSNPISSDPDRYKKYIDSLPD